MPFYRNIRGGNGTGSGREIAAEIAAHLPVVIQEAGRLSGGDAFTREDLVQEGLMAALNALNSYDPRRGNLEGFIRTCARNGMISYLRRNKYESPMENEALNAQMAGEGLTAQTGGQQERIEIKEALAKLIENLSGFEQSVLDAYLRGGALYQAARILGCDRKKVDNALQRIRNKARVNAGTEIE